jgi:hypothetical protein
MQDRAAAAGNDWVAGSLAPKRDPVQAAIAANDLRVARLQQSIADKTWEASMARVDSNARDATIQAVGAQGYANGIRNRSGKIDTAIAKLQPLVAAHVAKIDSLPRKTDADMEARMVQNLRGMKGVGKQYKQSR